MATPIDWYALGKLMGKNSKSGVITRWDDTKLTALGLTDNQKTEYNRGFDEGAANLTEFQRNGGRRRGKTARRRKVRASRKRRM